MPAPETAFPLPAIDRHSALTGWSYRSRLRQGYPGRAMALAVTALAACRAGGAAADPPPDHVRVDRRTHLVRTVERVGSAVVNISTEALVRNPYYGGTAHVWPFGESARPRLRERYVSNSLGSGVIVDPRGFVVTNEHVVAAASRITVTFLDGRQVPAEIVGTASGYDLALLRLEGAGPYPHVSVDFDERLYPGETVVAIGNPFGLQSSVTTGVLSGTHRRAESGGEHYTDFLQTDAAINPGNSGGALLTVNGDLIGINTQIDARGQNLGFAIPVARVRKVFDELVRHGEVLAVWTGLAVEALDPTDVDEALALRVPSGRGLAVRRVVGSSPAARAGLVVGDVLLEVGRESVTDYAELHTALSRISVGRTFDAVVWRSGARVPVTLAAEAFPVARAAELLWKHVGIRVGVGRARRPYVAVTAVRTGSQAALLGLPVGIAVVGVDGRRIASPDDVHAAMERALTRDSVLLTVTDGQEMYRVPLAVAE